MNWTQFSILVGVVATMLGIAVQLTRGIYKVAQVTEHLKTISEDMGEMRRQMQIMDERIYNNAIRGTQRR